MGVFEDGSENVGDVSEFVNGQAVASIAISLMRLADALEGRPSKGKPGEPGFDGGALGLADALCNAIWSGSER